MGLNSFRAFVVTRRRGLFVRAALLIGIFNVACFAQTENNAPAGAKPAVDNKTLKSVDDKPLTSNELEELLKLIRSLQERVEKLEAAQPSTDKSASTATVPSSSPAPVLPEETPNAESPAPVEAKPAGQDDGDKFDGRYTPNLGFRVVNTEYGDLN